MAWKKKITRIRYLEEDGVLTSQLLIGENDILMIKINLRNMICEIISDSGKLLVKNYKAKNRTDALKSMKKYAKEFGVLIHDEIRNKR